MGVISMQFCVVKYHKGTGIQILSHAFDSSLGGRTFEYGVNHFVLGFRIEATNDADLYWKLYGVCEKMKIELSSREDASFEVRLGFFKKIGSMKREELERMCVLLLERVKGPLEKALDDAGLSVEDVQSAQCIGLTHFFPRKPIHAEQENYLVSPGCTRHNYYTSHDMIRYYSIGPFQSKTDAKVPGKFTVRLDKNRIFSIELASISEDGKEVELQVLRLNELQEFVEESNQHEQLELDLREKKENRKQLDGQVEQLKESSNELSKFKREAHNESQQHEQTRNELKKIRNLLKIEKGKSTKQGDEPTNVRIEFEKHRFAEFSYAEVKEATNDFNDDNKIEKGGYSSVYKGVIHCTTVAIKVLNKRSDQGERV